MTANLIRKAREADIARMMEIRFSVRENILKDPNAVTEDDCRWFVQQGLLWVWDEAGIRGFTAGDPRKGWIWALFVDPAFEGLGLGKALLPYACSSLKEAGYASATLSTAPGTRAELFYERQGWTRAGHTTHGEIIFTKQL